MNFHLGTSAHSPPQAAQITAAEVVEDFAQRAGSIGSPAGHLEQRQAAGTKHAEELADVVFAVFGRAVLEGDFSVHEF